MLPTWTYLKDDEGIFVNLFIGGTMTVPDVAGGDVELVQKTDYPWDGRVTITVNPGEARELTMRVRVPHRGRSAIYHTEPQVEGIRDLAVNGEAIEAPVENGYAVIRRTWRPGDTIAFEVPMAIQRVHADERVAADRGRVALRRGPIVYNVESVDQNVDGLLAPDAALSAEWRPDLLGGVVALKGTWADGSELLAIPNYARHNRQVGEREESGAFGGPGTLGSDDGAQGRRPRRGGQSALSIVWIREQ